MDGTLVPFAVIGFLIGGGFGFWREHKAGSPLGWKIFGIFAGGFISATLLCFGILAYFFFMWSMSMN